MTKTILVCLDGTKFAEQIIPYAIERARQYKSKLILVRVVSVNAGALAVSLPGHPMFISAAVLESIVTGEEMKAKAYLGRVISRLRAMKIDASAVVLHKVTHDTVGGTISAYAEENTVSLIMIATHGYRGWKRLVFGSMAESVAKDSSVPVLAVQPGDSLAEDTPSSQKAKVAGFYHHN